MLRIEIGEAVGLFHVLRTSHSRSICGQPITINVGSKIKHLRLDLNITTCLAQREQHQLSFFNLSGYRFYTRRSRQELFLDLP